MSLVSGPDDLAPQVFLPERYADALDPLPPRSGASSVGCPQMTKPMAGSLANNDFAVDAAIEQSVAFGGNREAKEGLK